MRRVSSGTLSNAMTAHTLSWKSLLKIFVRVGNNEKRKEDTEKNPKSSAIWLERTSTPSTDFHRQEGSDARSSRSLES